MVVFTVPAKGVGRKDYTSTVERSTQPYVTPSLRQTRFTGVGTFVLPVLIFPMAWASLMSMPQEDGTWGWAASSIVMHTLEMSASVKSSDLITVAWLKYNSIADYMAGIPAERYAHIFSYGKARVQLATGIPTEQGKYYAIRFSAWPEGATQEITVNITGIATELTRPWMD